MSLEYMYRAQSLSKAQQSCGLSVEGGYESAMGGSIAGLPFAKVVSPSPSCPRVDVTALQEFQIYLHFG